MKYIKGSCFILAGMITSIVLSFMNDLIWINILKISMLTEVIIGIYFIKQDFDKKENSKQ